ncbi:AAA family ATPase, partial [candidate division WOR-3 bacterium]|nr:AAA family ATPase [candidate division WOR-3 bacterium]MBD3365463.1 AAA family ATPase [candidate division WOR-3 bacterium]
MVGINLAQDLLNLTPDSFEQPVATPELFIKIDRLAKITKEIEKNLVRSQAREPALHKKLKINYSKALNPMQLAAATATEGPVLVIAGAGSGKTRTIIYRVAYLLERGVPPEQILLLTFTRKAAREMMTRASRLLKDDRGTRIMGGTFHSFANHMLRRYSKLIALKPDFTIADTTDSADIIDFVRRELKLDKKKKAFPRKGRIQEIISKARNCDVPIPAIIEDQYTGLSEFTDDIELVAAGFTGFKRNHHILDFDDLMEVMREALKQSEPFHQRMAHLFRYVMVDEFQDTNTIQKEISDLLASKHRNIMVVGDDSQSIYSFRGANFENILRFPETYPDCAYIRIEQNYRSSPDILDFTNSVISQAKIGYRKHLFSRKKRKGKPEVRGFYDQTSEAEFIVDKILELREAGVPTSQMAVLYRATFHGTFVQAELLKRSIPYVVYGGIRFTERRHVKDMIAYLRIILNPLDAVCWNRVLKLIPGIGSVTASKIVRHVREHGGKFEFADFERSKYGVDLVELGDTLGRAADPHLSLASKIELLRAYYAPILANLEADHEVRLRDVGVLYELTARYEDLERFLSDFALDPPSNQFQDRTTPRIDESEEDPVVLSTVHSAKGLEWNTVFVVHLLDGLFPSDKAVGNIEE